MKMLLVKYGQARGYKQLYAEEYDIRNGIRGIGGASQDNWQKIINSYNTVRTDSRAAYFNKTYNEMKKKKWTLIMKRHTRR